MIAVTSADRSVARKSRAWNLTLILFPLFIAAGLLVLRQIEVQRANRRPVEIYGTVPPFELINQAGKSFGSADLAGKVWIADFIYTTCPGPCPMISSRMGEMQRPLEKTDVHFVSITVDPEKDTPAMLHRYAENLHAQAGRWDFLTGPKSQVYQLIVAGFKLPAAEHDGDQGQPLHSTRMVLVDRRGQIRGYYDAIAPDTTTRLIADANRLARER